MDNHNLITPAHQIDNSFGARSDPAPGRAEIASHSKRFRGSRIRRPIIADMCSAAGTGLSPIVITVPERLEPVGAGA